MTVFNDPDNPVQVLVTSVEVSSIAINLQKDYKRVIMEKPRKDFKEFVVHHIVTLALIAQSL